MHIMHMGACCAESALTNFSDNSSFSSKRLEAFHKKIIAYCATRGSWKKHIERNKFHMKKRADEKNDYARTAITDEMVAAILSQGVLVPDKSNASTPTLEIVVDGIIALIQYIDMENFKEIIERDLCFRVVVKERQNNMKHLVVTAYPLRDQSKNLLAPRVNHEIWK